jgi:enolase
MTKEIIMSEIASVYAREILDSRGNPTIEVDVITQSGALGRACVPSGASTGAFEALELRDKDASRYGGKGVLKAISHVNTELGPEMIGMDVTQQSLIDRRLLDLDGTENKAKYGANALLGISLAAAKAASEDVGLPLYQYIGGTGATRLPVPLMNFVNGGAHADNGLDIQEFMIVPVVGGSFRESLRAGSEIFHILKKILNSKGLATGVGDEGGFAPTLKSNEEALQLLSQAVEQSGYKLGEQIFFALDVAATELYDGSQYKWEGKKKSGEELGETYLGWSKKYPLISVEDGFSEEDWASWQKFTASAGERVQIVGDDLFVTNPKRLRKGIENKAANALLVKVNQIGTLTETYDAVQMAQRAQFATVMSHRSGETEDPMIADLAVGMGCPQIKTGSLCRSERTAKYNQLLRIEEELSSGQTYWGKSAFRSLGLGR